MLQKTEYANAPKIYDLSVAKKKKRFLRCRRKWIFYFKNNQCNVANSKFSTLGASYIISRDSSYSTMLRMQVALRGPEEFFAIFLPSKKPLIIDK